MKQQYFIDEWFTSWIFHYTNKRYCIIYDATSLWFLKKLLHVRSKTSLCVFFIYAHTCKKDTLDYCFALSMTYGKRRIPRTIYGGNSRNRFSMVHQTKIFFSIFTYVLRIYVGHFFYFGKYLNLISILYLNIGKLCSKLIFLLSMYANVQIDLYLLSRVWVRCVDNLLPA